jgi:diacylglycerol kinase family enzyme
LVPRCIDALRGKKKVEIAIVPAGTGNLLATKLGIRSTSPRPSTSACTAAGATLDVGVVNGERFAVMAGAGFDAIDDA